MTARLRPDQRVGRAAKQGRGRAKTNPDAVRVALRRGRACELRISGLSFGQIADALREELSDLPAGYERSSVYRDVIDSVRVAQTEPGAELIILECSRLDAMLAGLWPAATSGDVAAVRAVIAIMERRARYVGLDAPVPQLWLDGAPAGAATDPDEAYRIGLAALQTAIGEYHERQVPRGGGAS